jgi:heterodisulfide reductase subunit C
MRQLIGKMQIKHRNVTEEIYLAECVRCQNCQATVPIGIEVITVRKEGTSKKVVKHGWYCRAHGADYSIRALG